MAENFIASVISSEGIRYDVFGLYRDCVRFAQGRS